MKNPPIGALLAALLLALAGGHARAQTGERDLLSERDFLTEIPRVISASRLPQAPADSPGAVTVIDRDMIRASGARDVAELFRLVPGFAVGYASGGRPVVAYHGLSGQISQRMQVLLDGRSLYAPYLFGGIDWNTLPVNMDDIERIEVLRGSNSAAYGANAFLGVANIITRSAAQSRGAYGSATAGTEGVRDAAARIGGGGGGLDWRLSAGTRRDNGLTGAFDDRRLNYLSGTADWQINESDQLSLSAGLNDNRLGLGVANSAGDPERFENTSSSFGQVRWRRSFAPDHEMSFAASHTSDRGEDRFSIPVTATDALVIDYGRKALRDHFGYQHYLGVNEQIRASWGVEYRKESVVAPQLFNTSEAQRTEASRAYLNAEWSVNPAWTVNVGGLVEHESLSGTHVAPRLTANWKFDAGQVLRVGYTDAFRTPSLFEQRSDWRYVYNGQTIDVRYLSSGGLRPERVRATELSYLGDFRRLGLNVDARLFHERVTDLITQQLYSLPPGQEFDPESGVYDLRNADSATITGVEYQLRWRPSANQQWLFGHYLAHRSGSADFVGESIPTYSAHVLGMFRLSDDRSLSVFYGLQAPIRWIGETTTAPSQHRLDVRFEQAFRAEALRGTIALVGQNLLGPETEFRAGQTMPRRIWLTISLDR